VKKASITLTAMLIKPALIVAVLALIYRAVGWSGLEPAFVESAADTLSEATSLPHADCAAAIIVVLAFAAYQIVRAVFGLRCTARP
jgi:hypothetical protein